jgi:MFS family permease
MSVVTEALRETGSSLGMVFRNPALRKLNLAFAGSAIGDWAYATAMAVWVYSVGGLTAVGIWGTIRLVIMTLVTPFASILVDRYSRKRIMVSTDLLRGTVVFVCAILIMVEAPVWTVFVLATLTSVFAAPFRPAVAALLPHLVDRPEELTAANGTSSTIDSLSFFVGPALGGLLLTFTTVPVVMFVNVVSFLWSAALVAGIRVPHPTTVPAVAGTENDSPEATEVSATETEGDTLVEEVEEVEEEKESFVQESIAGFKTIWSISDLRLVSLVYCAQTIVAGASVVYGIAMAVEMTNFGPNGVGYLDSMFGVGAIIGGLVALGRASKMKVATDFGWGVILWAIPLLLAAVFPHAWAALLAVAIMGFGNPLVDVNAMTIVQRLGDDKVMGRIFGALETGLIAAMALGSVLMPLLLHLFGLQWALAVLAIGISAVVLPFMGRLRRMNAALGEPEGLRLLRALPLFAPLEPKSLELVAQQLVRREVAAGEAVITEGAPGDVFYVVESGALTASFRGEVLSHQGPGDPFGEIALLRDVPRTATVVADEPTVLYSLDREAFLAAVTGNSEVSGQADDLIARRIPTY